MGLIARLRAGQDKQGCRLPHILERETNQQKNQLKFIVQGSGTTIQKTGITMLNHFVVPVVLFRGL